MTKCTSCGIEHGMVIEDMTTGETNPIDWCKDCFFSKGYTYKAPDPIDLSELDNWAQKLKEMEKSIIGDMSR